MEGIDPHTQTRLRELLAILVNNPQHPQIAAALQTSAPPQTGAPPPYPDADNDDAAADDDEDDDEDGNQDVNRRGGFTTEIHIDASTHIHGSNNVVSTLGAHALVPVVYAALRQLQPGVPATTNTTLAHVAPVVAPRSSSGRAQLRLNCGTVLRGNGNRVLLQSWTPAPTVVAGQKRAAEDDGERGGREAKVARREEGS
ncbi:MAG: hypothetical protein M1822_004044 [Bathelium mastoideum]|nr:MAG: hypothetical protein M1822_004044 [Bathelium mastoideum]